MSDWQGGPDAGWKRGEVRYVVPPGDTITVRVNGDEFQIDRDPPPEAPRRRRPALLRLASWLLHRLARRPR